MESGARRTGQWQRAVRPLRFSNRYYGANATKARLPYCAIPATSQTQGGNDVGKGIRDLRARWIVVLLFAIATSIGELQWDAHFDRFFQSDDSFGGKPQRQDVRIGSPCYNKRYSSVTITSSDSQLISYTPSNQHDINFLPLFNNIFESIPICLNSHNIWIYSLPREDCISCSILTLLASPDLVVRHQDLVYEIYLWSIVGEWLHFQMNVGHCRRQSPNIFQGIPDADADRISLNYEPSARLDHVKIDPRTQANFIELIGGISGCSRTFCGFSQFGCVDGAFSHLLQLALHDIQLSPENNGGHYSNDHEGARKQSDMARPSRHHPLVDLVLGISATAAAVFVAFKSAEYADDRGSRFWWLPFLCFLALAFWLAAHTIPTNLPV
jgi:hypothetical protein